MTTKQQRQSTRTIHVTPDKLWCRASRWGFPEELARFPTTASRFSPPPAPKEVEDGDLYRVTYRLDPKGTLRTARFLGCKYQNVVDTVTGKIWPACWLPLSWPDGTPVSREVVLL